jgi:hypothetical protein
MFVWNLIIYTYLNCLYLLLAHSRRDDLESLGYVILEMLRGTLPWAGVTARNAIEGWAKMLKMKARLPLEELFEGVPRGFMDFLQYARNLDFEQEPDYNYARNLLMSYVIRNRFFF